MLERVLVSVKRGGEAGSRDLELPAEVDMGRLVEMIASAMGWVSGNNGSICQYEIEAKPAADAQGKGRVLGPQETLASAGIWDGSWLTVRATTSTPSSPGPLPGKGTASPRPPASSGPVARWRPLEVNLLPGNGDRNPPGTDGSHPGFKWTRIDK